MPVDPDPSERALSPQSDHAAAAPVNEPGTRLPLARPRWRTLIAIMAALALIAAALVVLSSPMLEVRTVNVSGAQHLSEDALAQLAGLRGENILLADLGAARARLLSQPLVKDAAVSREWPDRIDIVIQERVPWARWQVGDEIWAIDAQGVVLEGRQAPADSTLVRQVSSLPAIRGGAHVDVDAVDLIRRLEERGPPSGGPDILAFEWSLKTGLTVVTQHGRVTFGDTAGFDFKYQVWEQLEWEARGRGEPLLDADLRFGTRPAVEMGLGMGRATRILEPEPPPQRTAARGGD